MVKVTKFTKEEIHFPKHKSQVFRASTFKDLEQRTDVYNVQLRHSINIKP